MSHIKIIILFNLLSHVPIIWWWISVLLNWGHLTEYLEMKVIDIIMETEKTLDRIAAGFLITLILFVVFALVYTQGGKVIDKLVEGYWLLYNKI